MSDKLYIDWLGPGHYRSDLYGVYGRNAPLDARKRRPQLFRGTLAECETWIASHTV